MVTTFKDRLKAVDPVFVCFDTLQTLQINLGNLCNMNCRHCHVNASPDGRQIMEQETVEKIVRVLKARPGLTLDITGGCPEIHPHFRDLIERTDGVPSRRMVRTNLTVLTEPGMEWLETFYVEHDLVLIGSLPCYMEENVDSQRGKGAYQRSIAALKRLNAAGYGLERELNLVYNPGEDFIPGSQLELEAAYKKALRQRYGIEFTHLYTITNAPIGRFREYLEARGTYERYMKRLSTRFNPVAAENIMCRTLVSVDWKGFLYNCDFNQAVGLPITNKEGEILKLDDLEIAVQSGTELFLAQHCYCCTAGEGSSCTGALAS